MATIRPFWVGSVPKFNEFFFTAILLSSSIFFRARSTELNQCSQNEISLYNSLTRSEWPTASTAAVSKIRSICRHRLKTHTRYTPNAKSSQNWAIAMHQRETVSPGCNFSRNRSLARRPCGLWRHRPRLDSALRGYCCHEMRGDQSARSPATASDQMTDSLPVGPLVCWRRFATEWNEWGCLCFDWEDVTGTGISTRRASVS